jgi:hypothetical protein
MTKPQKVALLSFHNAINYGACLQAYALQTAVQDMGIACEYLNYCNQRRQEGYDMGARMRKALRRRDVKTLVRTLCGLPFAAARKRKFARFYRAHVKTTQHIYRTCDELAAVQNAYDKFVVGSDQVWNDAHNGADPAYFLAFTQDTQKTVSYASSFGASSIPPEDQARYARLLGHIGCLSTREMRGVQLIAQLTGRAAHMVLDPVFLLEPAQWLKLLPAQKRMKPYTFYYLNAQFELAEFARRTGYQDRRRYILSSAVTLSDFAKKGQRVTFAMSPQQFLAQIYHAELVVTTSFHCLAFAILFQKPFVAVLSGDAGRDERLLNLLQITHLESRIFTGGMQKGDVLAAIDYADVFARLKPYVAHSHRFLQLALLEGKPAADALIAP